MNELLRLRSEVGRARENSRELSQLKAAISNDSGINATLKSWSVRAAQLKLRLEQMPDKKIPELELLTDKEWFDAVKSGKPLETEADFRKALKELRNIAKVDFAELTRSALKKFAVANGGNLPADLSLLQPYFEMPVDSSVIQRYSILQSGKLGDALRGEPLFAEKAAPADMEYDSSYEFSMNGTTSWDVNDPKDIVSRGMMEFAKEHQGNLPKDASQLAPYLSRQIDEGTANKVLAMIPAGVVTLNQLKALDK
ncbi:MAG: hypothetical protein JWN25_546 [Verrucomicrobiales bacterium]|nr:hypothetical protein [Verrucomicrobiales bacterium]